MRYRVSVLVLLVALLPVPAAWPSDVANTKHNLSTSGPGDVTAASETEICIFCHTPHNSSARAPLWNRQDPGGTYETYTSSTVRTRPGQPTGASRLCLSCHDGTVALGKVTSRREIRMSGSPTIPSGRSRIGTDISDDHPVSFDYSSSQLAAGAELRANPAARGKSLLDANGDVQCTSCHDAHDDSFGDFLRVDPANGALCLKCHQPTNWSSSSHATSTRTWNGAGRDPWPNTTETTVAANACDNCHTPHQAEGPERLFIRAPEEDVCLPCHNGNVASTNIANELSKWRTHDVAQYADRHDPTEQPDGKADHVECVDCHNTHQSRSTPVGDLPGALVGASGYGATGQFLKPATREFEVCYKCHADATASTLDSIPRQAGDGDIQRQFDPSNPSHHAVEAAGVNPDVPSLLPEWTAASRVTCSDCHNNDAGPGAGGSGPAGPHGSRFDFLLERRLETTLPQPESSAVYALCYKCHSRTSILNDESFAEHKRHVVDKDVPCTACHAPHGVEPGAGGDHTHLINFDTRYAKPNSSGRLEFRDDGRFAGTCWVNCHGGDHGPESYGGSEPVRATRTGVRRPKNGQAPR